MAALAAATGKKGGAWRGAMGWLRATVAVLMAAAGVAVLGGWAPGEIATGPRIGVGMLLLTWGVLLAAIPASVWFVRHFARPEEGGCPVGEPCAACGAFNLKPRAACRSCGGPVNQA